MQNIRRVTLHKHRVLVAALCVWARLSAASPSPDAQPERSVADSNFARTAGYLMRTAMKLPPHILPTLDELASGPTTPGLAVSGVYVPEHKPVGMYEPLPRRKDVVHTTESLPPAESTSGAGPAPPPPRRRRQRPPRQLLPFDPHKPMQLAESLGERIRTLKGNINRAHSRGHRRPGTKRGDEGDEDESYDFVKPNFHLPFEERSDDDAAPSPSSSGSSQSPSEPVESSRRSRPGPRRRVTSTPFPPSEYVPSFLKQMLARMFLRNPEHYLRHLEEQNRLKKEQEEEGEEVEVEDERRRKFVDRPQRRKTPRQPFRFRQKSRATKGRPLRRRPETKEVPPRSFATSPPPPPPPRPRTSAPPSPPPSAPTLEKPFSPSAHIEPPKTSVPYAFDGNANGNNVNHNFEDFSFEKYLPPNLEIPSDYSLQKFNEDDASYYIDKNDDEGFPLYEDDTTTTTTTSTSFHEQFPRTVGTSTSTEAFSSAETLPSTESSTEKTICICCENASVRYHPNHAYKRRTLRISDESQIERLETERSIIEERLDCSKQDPIEVVLVFESKRTEPLRARNPTFTSTPANVRLTPDYFQDGLSAEQQHQLTFRKTTLLPRTRRRRPHASTPVSMTLTSDVLKSKNDEVAADGVYYDPTKLTFIFSTPSPLRRKYIAMRDRMAVDEDEPSEMMQESVENVDVMSSSKLVGPQTLAELLLGEKHT